MLNGKRPLLGGCGCQLLLKGNLLSSLLDSARIRRHSQAALFTGLAFLHKRLGLFLGHLYLLCVQGHVTLGRGRDFLASLHLVEHLLDQSLLFCAQALELSLQLFAPLDAQLIRVVQLAASHQLLVLRGQLLAHGR